jgi:membrane-associated protease RseP (regulator of RpoE activity)
MWIREVDVPAVLVNEFRAGNLVLFVGAGASVDPPASLPTFVGLTKRIAIDTYHDCDEAELEHPDVLLGRIEDRGVDVHRIIKTIIGDPASAPNDLHWAIAWLAAAGSPVRIVTTNYDEHRLLSALSEEEQQTLADLLRRLLAGFESQTSDVAAEIGLTLEPAHLARARRHAVGLSDTPGLLVSSVTADSPAADAGVQQGDLLTAVDGTPTRSSVALGLLLDDLSGRRRNIEVTLLRGSEQISLRIHLPNPT